MANPKVVTDGIELLNDICNLGVFEGGRMIYHESTFFLLVGVEVVLSKNFFGLEKGNRLFIVPKLVYREMKYMSSGPNFLVKYCTQQDPDDDWYNKRGTSRCRYVHFDDAMEEMKTIVD